MGYWDETDKIIGANGGVNPICPDCGKMMIPIDEHGRFFCGCLDISLPTPRIIQVDTNEMTNTEKATIPAINRLNSIPTEAEAKMLALLLQEPNAMNSPEYIEACKAIKEERRK